MKSSIINELLSIEPDELIKLFKNDKIREEQFPTVQFNFTDNSLYLNFDEYNYIIFLKEIKVILTDKDNKLSKIVRTNIQIKNFLDYYDIDINKIIINEYKNKFKDCLAHIDLYIMNDIINLKTIAKKIPYFIFIKDCITLNSNYNPEKYSKFFYDYFPHIKKLEQNGVFK